MNKKIRFQFSASETTQLEIPFALSIEVAVWRYKDTSEEKLRLREWCLMIAMGVFANEFDHDNLNLDGIQIKILSEEGRVIVDTLSIANST